MRPLNLPILILGFSALTHAQQITSVTGSVSVRLADDAPWSAAQAGAAIVPGTSILAGPKAAAEIRLNTSDSFLAGAGTQFKYAGVENDRYQVELTRGKLTYQSADPAVDSLRVNLPGVGVEPVQPGIYQIEHTAGGQSQITVQAGLARVVAPGGAELVNAGQKMLVRYTASGPEFRVVSAFSRWRRFLNIAGAAIQVAGNVSAVTGTVSTNEASPKVTLPLEKSASSTPKPVDTRQRSDPPPAHSTPSTPPASKTK